jgi:ketosteroid isomerase-like protein
MNPTTLPAPVAAYIDATNRFDLDGLVATFADDALVNDHREEFAGRDAIRAWAGREIVGDRVTMRVTEAHRRGHAVAVTASIDGDFDKTGLPNPLLLTFYFCVGGERIDQLVIVHNKRAA